MCPGIFPRACEVSSSAGRLVTVMLSRQRSTVVNPASLKMFTAQTFSLTGNEGLDVQRFGGTEGLSLGRGRVSVCRRLSSRLPLQHQTSGSRIQPHRCHGDGALGSSWEVLSCVWGPQGTEGTELNVRAVAGVGQDSAEPGLGKKVLIGLPGRLRQKKEALIFLIIHFYVSTNQRMSCRPLLTLCNVG